MPRARGGRGARPSSALGVGKMVWPNAGAAMKIAMVTSEIRFMAFLR
jgi:hypothetical protein